MHIENIIFDFGDVLLNWNPRHLYKNYFSTEAEMENFLGHICTDAWNLEQDKGRPLTTATTLLQKEFPIYHEAIQLYYDQWEIMLHSDIPGTVELLYQLKKRYKIYGLTNWSAETIPIAYKRFPFFKEFDGIVVSGDVKMIKPDRRIYEHLLEKYHLKPEASIFIDDKATNADAASTLGMHGIQFENPTQLKEKLSEMGVL